MVDAVWSTAKDGRWHRLLHLAKQMRFNAEEIGAALDFLERYGFAQSSSVHGRKFKMITDGPYPMEATKILQLVALTDDRRLLHNSWEPIDFSSRKEFHNFLLRTNASQRRSDLRAGAPP